MDENLTFKDHIDVTINSCSSNFFALRKLKQHGLCQKLLQEVFKVKVISKLLYGSLAWWGFINKRLKTRLDTFLKKAVKFRYYPESGLGLDSLVTKQEGKLFKSISRNNSHCLQKLLPL